MKLQNKFGLDMMHFRELLSFQISSLSLIIKSTYRNQFLQISSITTHGALKKKDKVIID